MQYLLCLWVWEGLLQPLQARARQKGIACAVREWDFKTAVDVEEQ